jgi:adenylate cyclase
MPAAGGALMQVPLDTARSCLEGTIPAVIATCSADGTPNATYVSQMQYLDAGHVALTFQFFNKTRENILANPQATALVIDPVTAASYRLSLLYLRTETEGPLFQAMKARLAGIASHTGMTDVFKLRGADIYAVPSVEQIKGDAWPRPPRARNLLHALRLAGQYLGECADLGALFDQTLTLLAQEFRINHAMLLVADGPGQRLFTVASRGYSVSGVGSEIAFGDGVIGVAAQYRVPIRINHMTLEYRYGRVSHSGTAGADPLESAIPFPGLAEPHTQLAVPVTVGARLLGVLCVESPQDLAFNYDDEDALVALACLVGTTAAALQQTADASNQSPTISTRAAPQGPVVEVRHYRSNHSVFVGSEYLIKGVAGAILWKLLQVQAESGRSEFSNRELRAMPDLGLPELSDNLEARLVLLQRRLAERCPVIALEKTGRGQMRLVLRGRLRLSDVDD